LLTTVFWHDTMQLGFDQQFGALGRPKKESAMAQPRTRPRILTNDPCRDRRYYLPRGAS
jgi:hypothetical protein